MEKRSNNTGLMLAILALGLGIGIVMHRSPLFFGNCCSYVTYPFLKMYNAVQSPIIRWRENRQTNALLKSSIEHLVAERDYLLSENIALQSLKGFSEDSQEAREFKQRYAAENGVVAQIIAKSFSPKGHFFLIDAGRSHGMKENMVAVANNTLIGRVVQVFPLYSKVVAITDAACKVAVVCAKSKTEGIHEGMNTLNETTVRYVSHLKSLVADDMLISSGEGLVFPRGFGIGKVIDYTNDGLFYSVRVKPLVDLNSVKYCCCVHKGIEETYAV